MSDVCLVMEIKAECQIDVCLVMEIKAGSQMSI